MARLEATDHCVDLSRVGPLRVQAALLSAAAEARASLGALGRGLEGPRRVGVANRDVALALERVVRQFVSRDVVVDVPLRPVEQGVDSVVSLAVVEGDAVQRGPVVRLRLAHAAQQRGRAERGQGAAHGRDLPEDAVDAVRDVVLVRPKPAVERLHPRRRQVRLVDVQVEVQPLREVPREEVRLAVQVARVDPDHRDVRRDARRHVQEHGALHAERGRHHQALPELGVRPLDAGFRRHLGRHDRVVHVRQVQRGTDRRRRRRRRPQAPRRRRRSTRIQLSRLLRLLRLLASPLLLRRQPLRHQDHRHPGRHPHEQRRDRPSRHRPSDGSPRPARDYARATLRSPLQLAII
mmetsp:Transcript_1523/g.4606  ORF Transcript_1523/g.4606 Transcript_1523/m.4606 type:complete len:350 (-) Transcript_1523:41-1090(-)